MGDISLVLNWYHIVGLGSVIFAFGGLSAVVKSNRVRINKTEKKQEEDEKLLHTMDGKMDILIDLVKNGVKDKKKRKDKELKDSEHSDLGR